MRMTIYKNAITMSSTVALIERLEQTECLSTTKEHTLRDHRSKMEILIKGDS